MSDHSHPTEEDLALYADHSLSSDRKRMVETHLSTCHSCFLEVVEISRLRAAEAVGLLPELSQHQKQSLAELIRLASRATDRKQKVLVVDDERPIVRLVQVCLERAGYQVVAAFAGEDALRKVESEKPDLIVLDTMMPHMDGPQVLRRLRAIPATHIPVIMLTAASRHAHVCRGWTLGAPSYLTKPFSPPELLASVTRTLSGANEYGQSLNTHSL